MKKKITYLFGAASSEQRLVPSLPLVLCFGDEDESPPGDLQLEGESPLRPVGLVVSRQDDGVPHPVGS